MPPPPPIIYNYTIEETLTKAHSLTYAFLAKIRKSAAFFWRPLKYKRHVAAKARRAPPRALSILLLAASLGLTHCSSDGGGGGGGNGSSDDPAAPAAPSDPAAPSLSAIYIWRTECHVIGNIEGSGSFLNGVSPCDTSALTGEGRAKAKQLCEARFTAVLADGIKDEPSDAALRHEPLLAVDGIDGSSAANRQAFIPDGDVTKAVKIPANGNGLASSWEAFLDPGIDIMEGIPHGTGSNVSHYTGLDTSFAVDTAKNCADWTSDAAVAATGGVPSGSTLSKGPNRLSFSATILACSATLRGEILCITY